jgi:phytanoyl-CoA hydroxylase
MHTGPAVFNLITHRRLLDIVEQSIGPEILSNSI